VKNRLIFELETKLRIRTELLKSVAEEPFDEDFLCVKSQDFPFGRSRSGFLWRTESREKPTVNKQESRKERGMAQWILRLPCEIPSFMRNSS
jgi:hypothetical protein